MLGRGAQRGGGVGRGDDWGGLAAPEAVEVAVGVDVEDFVVGNEGELGLGVATGLEVLELVAGLGLEDDPGDGVRLAHRVLERADAHPGDAVFERIDREVLFARAVARARNEELHLFAAAGQRRGGFMDEANELAALLATIEFHRTPFP